MKAHPIFQKIKNDFKYSPIEIGFLLFAFSLPFGGVFNSYFLGLSILLLIYGLVNQSYELKIRLPKKLFSLTFIYLVLLFGIFRTNALATSGNLLLDISLLVFPILFALTGLKINRKKILYAFVAGCVSSSLLCLLLSAKQFYFENFESGIYFYASLSHFLHVGYFSMYLLFSLFAIFLLLIKSDNGKLVFLKILLIIFHLLMLVLLSTRTSFIALGVIGLAFLISTVFILKKRMKGLLMLVALCILFSLGLVFLNSKNENRFDSLLSFFTEKQIDPSSIESVDARFMVWKSSVQIIQQNFWVGVGPGNAKAKLKEQFLINGYTGIAAEGLNAHNEFLQTLIATGVIGFIALLLCIFTGVPAAFQQRDFLFVTFTIIIVINFLTESMLERQAGVVFFAFFNSLFVFSKSSKSAVH